MCLICFPVCFNPAPSCPLCIWFVPLLVKQTPSWFTSEPEKLPKVIVQKLSGRPVCFVNTTWPEGGGSVRLLILWAISGSCLYPLKLTIIHRYGSYAWGAATWRYHFSLHQRLSSSTCLGPKQKSYLFIPCLTGAVWGSTVEPEIMTIIIIVIMLPDISATCWTSHNTPGLIQSFVKHALCLIKPFLPLIHICPPKPV